MLEVCGLLSMIWTWKDMKMNVFPPPNWWYWQFYEMRKRNVFPTIIILAFYGILWSKVRKWRTFTYPLEWMSCMCGGWKFWSYSSSSGWTRGVMDREIRWFFISSTKTCWICSKMLKIIVFMSSKLIGTIPTMWKDVLMSNIVGNCWLSVH